MRPTRALLLATALLAVSCATAYQPVDPHDALAEGYSEHQLAPDSWRVHFQGNNVTSLDTVRKLVIRRCAELAGQAGYSRLVIDVLDSERTGSQDVTFIDRSPHPWGLPYVTPPDLGVRLEYSARPSGWALVRGFNGSTAPIPGPTFTVDAILSQYR